MLFKNCSIEIHITKKTFLSHIDAPYNLQKQTNGTEPLQPGQKIIKNKNSFYCEIDTTKKELVNTVAQSTEITEKQSKQLIETFMDSNNKQQEGAATSDGLF
ncbi:MAG: hypothetical protein VR65_21035 [Desulfobulbaceae bacterium BRH_c16a]|nr:MAG: hypothetical protein VR65_21035 [Desulfobulbaceae bacterium BRH_c16a]